MNPSTAVSKEHWNSEGNLRKLLSSHSSIYNALANPDLDMNVPTSPPLTRIERFTPSPLNGLSDPTASILSWQSIHLPSSHPMTSTPSNGLRPDSVRPSTASILSNQSDEDESLVVVPSEVMLFETDEESSDEDLHRIESSTQSYFEIHAADDDESTLVTHNHNSQKCITIPQNRSTSFVMPKMSVLENEKHFSVTLLSSADSFMEQGSKKLADFLQPHLQSFLLQSYITHLALSTEFLNTELSIIQSSDLIVLINDGSHIFSELLRSASTLVSQDEMPKLTLVNVLTTNYFINLLDIIDAWKPDQVWKTPSLSSDSFMLKVKSFMEEFSEDSESRYAQEFESKKEQFSSKFQASDATENPPANSVYCSVNLVRRPDYKELEKLIRSELLLSHAYKDADPLRLSSNLGGITYLVELVKRVFSNKDTFENMPRRFAQTTGACASLLQSLNFWLICSFSMGLGVGITFANGAIGYFAVWAREQLRLLFKSSPKLVVFWHEVKDESKFSTKELGFMRLSKAAQEVNTGLINFSKQVTDRVTGTINHFFVDQLISFFNDHYDAIRAFNSSVMSSVVDGYEKASSLCMGFLQILV